MLAARADGLGNIFGLRGRHHEDDVLGRLLQSLQQRVKRRVGDLVGFVQKIDFVAVSRRGIARCVPQFANLVDPAVGGGVDLDHVEGVAGANLLTGVANPARFGRGPFRAANLVAAIQRHGKDSGDGCFADAAMSAEDVPVGHPLLLESVAQGTSHVLLTGDIGEALGTVFAG